MSDGPKPHKGGPILPSGCVTVLIGGKPAARAGDDAACAGSPDAIAKGSPTVFIGYEEAARLGDVTEHGGAVVQGEASVVIGDTGDGEPFTVWKPAAGQGERAAPGAGAAGEAAPAKEPAAKPAKRPAPPQVAALRAAAAQGKPFCEVCERKRRRRRAAEHDRERT